MSAVVALCSKVVVRFKILSEITRMTVRKVVDRTMRYRWPHQTVLARLHDRRMLTNLPKSETHYAQALVLSEDRRRILLGRHRHGDFVGRYTGFIEKVVLMILGCFRCWEICCLLGDSPICTRRSTRDSRRWMQNREQSTCS